MSAEVDLFAGLDSGIPSPDPGTDPETGNPGSGTVPIPGPPEEIKVDDPEAGAIRTNKYSHCRDEACGHFLEKHMPSEGGGFVPCYALRDDGTPCGCRCFRPNTYVKDGQPIVHYPESIDEMTGEAT